MSRWSFTGTPDFAATASLSSLMDWGSSISTGKRSPPKVGFRKTTTLPMVLAELWYCQLRDSSLRSTHGRGPVTGPELQVPFLHLFTPPDSPCQCSPCHSSPHLTRAVQGLHDAQRDGLSCTHSGAPLRRALSSAPPLPPPPRSRCRCRPPAAQCPERSAGPPSAPLLARRPPCASCPGRSVPRL